MSQQNKGPNEDFMMGLFILIIVVTVCLIIWFLFSNQLKEVIRWVRVTELYFIMKFIDPNLAVVHPSVGKQRASDWLSYLKAVDVRRMTITDIRVSTYVAVLPLKKYFMVIFGLMGGYLLFGNPGGSFKRRLNLETLIAEQAKSFPTIAPFVKFDPRKLPFRAPGQPVPVQLPPFAEALSPEEWLAHNNIKLVAGQVDPVATYTALVKQLGRRWQGPLKLEPYAQGLYAAFALKHVRKRADSDALLNELALAWTIDKGFRPGMGLMRRIRKIIKNPKIGGALQKYADQHAFETTALLRCLSRAREEGGVLAPAMFVWLRAHDRKLWYPLNNLGRKSYHAEAAGAMVHYTNEIIAGQRIPTPRFEEVVRTIDAYMKSGAARAIPELDKKAVGKYWKIK